MRKTGKFFVICGVVCAVGAIMTAAGYAMGGVDDMSKVSDRYDWLTIGPAEMNYTTMTDLEYNAIKTKGDIDLAVIDPDSFLLGEEGDSLPEWVMDDLVDIDGRPGTVLIGCRDTEKVPDVTVEKGVLKINNKLEETKVNVDLSDEDPIPDVIVFCGKDALKTIDVDNDCGDVDLLGIKSKKITIKNDTGDICLENVKSSGMDLTADTGDIEVTGICKGWLNAVSDTGDIEISGTCKCDVTATVDTGDIGFYTTVPQDQYQVSLFSELEDVVVNGDEMDTNEYIANGRPYSLKCQTDTGEIVVEFASIEEL